MSRWTLFKIALSIALLVSLLFLVDRQELLQALKSISLPFVIIITVVYIAGQIFSAYKWFLIIRAAGIAVSFPAACKAYFLGMFVNFFGLGVVGGDVTRALLITQKGDSKTQAMATVIADRAHGLAVLTTIGVVAGLYWGHASIPNSLFMLLVAFGAALFLGWFFGPMLLLKLVSPSNRFRIQAEKIADAFPKSKAVMVKISVVSAFFHFWQIFMHVLIANHLSNVTNWSAFLVSVPFINIFSSLPISWNGLGVREAGYVFFLTPQPLTKELALTMGAVWLLATTISNILGGVIALVTGDFRKLLNFSSPKDN